MREVRINARLQPVHRGDRYEDPLAFLLERSFPGSAVTGGGTLVSARVADADRSRLDSILNESAINLRDRSAAWQKAGWKSFDPASKPYGAEEVRKERQLYGGALR